MGDRVTRWEIIADSATAAHGMHVQAFGPYVPSVNSRGVVAYQATLASGRTIIVASDGTASTVLVPRAATSLESALESHPDLNDAGDYCAYGRLGASTHMVTGAGVVRIEGGVGPLGPTINARGDIGFRGYDAVGAETIGIVAEGCVLTLAKTGHQWRAFHGLPVVTEAFAVVFRAESHAGLHVLCMSTPSETRILVDTSLENTALQSFSALGLFPSVNARGVIAFAGIARSGEAGIYTWSEGNFQVVTSGSAFSSYRGALIDDAGRVLFFATSQEGALGIYAAHGAECHRLLAVGDGLAGSIVTEFAANPVSLSGDGIFAARIGLADGRELIARHCFPWG
jgi:hypothetical protein